jgi:hypothetical protein
MKAMIAAKVTHAKTEEPWDAEFSMQYTWRLYNKALSLAAWVELWVSSETGSLQPVIVSYSGW